MNPSHASLPSIVSHVAGPLPAERARGVPLVVPVVVMAFGVAIGWSLGLFLFGGLG
jgi:hypothetical protein